MAEPGMSNTAAAAVRHKNPRWSDVMLERIPLILKRSLHGGKS